MYQIPGVRPLYPAFSSAGCLMTLISSPAKQPTSVEGGLRRLKDLQNGPEKRTRSIDVDGVEPSIELAGTGRRSRVARGNGGGFCLRGA